MTQFHSKCHGPVVSDTDGIRYCPQTGSDDYDCEACRWEAWDEPGRDE